MPERPAEQSVNVRCPNCSAVFPVATAASRQVECPLCLLRFEANEELTISAAQMPAQARGASAPNPDDEFEAFGRPAPIHANTEPVQFARTTAPISTVRSTGPSPMLRSTVPFGSQSVQKTSAPSLPGPLQAEKSPAIGVDSPSVDLNLDDGEIDFDALLSDAVLAVDKKGPSSSRTNAFARIASPRSGAGVADDAVFGAVAKPAWQEPKSRAAVTVALDDSSLFESPGVGGARADEDQPEASRPAAEPARRPSPVLRNRVKKQPLGPKLLRGTATLLVALAAAGGIAHLAGYGWFGSKMWQAPPPKAKVRKALSADLTTPVAQYDSRKTYEAEIRRLEQVAASQPDDRAPKKQLLIAYLDLLERAPKAMDLVPQHRKRLDILAKELGAPPRLAVLDAMAAGNAVLPEAFLLLDQGGPDDRALAVRARIAEFEQNRVAQALANPGLTSSADLDPLRAKGNNDPGLVLARTAMDRLLIEAKGLPNGAKFVVLDSLLRDHMNDWQGAAARLQPITTKADDHAEARALLASALLELGDIEPAMALAQEAARLAEEQELRGKQREAHLVRARVAAKQGDREAMIKALQAAVEAVPADELTTIRLARLLMAEKHSGDAQKLLMAAKKSGMKSVAFEVAVVEFWLSVNRNQDALDEITQATKLYAESVDLQFLRGQVEDKAQHFATARDYFVQVINKEPRHLRAIVRLAELQSAAGKHDDALTTLQRARETLGDDETVLRLQVEELLALKRDKEARDILGLLLGNSAHNRQYLLRAAQLDLKDGEVDRALGFLRRLRQDKALDREAAIQMAAALSSKQQPDEAAQTLMPFAEQAGADVELNTLAGRYLVDAKDYDRARNVLQRAVVQANGKSPESLFQFGRLAFRRGEVDQGISRMQQAIDGDKLAWQYRLELARSVFDLASRDGARELAVKELNTVLGGEESFRRAGRPVTQIADVHRLLARHFFEQHRYAQAIPHLRAVAEQEPDDADSLQQLGRALHGVNAPDAAKVLRAVMQRRPGDAQAALALGLGALNRHQTSEAMHWLQIAGDSGKSEVAEAWYHLALIHKDRDQPTAAMRAVERYLKDAKADDSYRDDAATLRRELAGSHRK